MSMKDEDNDIVPEDLDDSVVEEEGLQEKVKKLKEGLKQAEGKAKEYLDSWQRAQADFVNLRKRDEEAKAEFIKFAQKGLIEDLIPVLDSFNIAVSGGHKDLEPLNNQLIKVLKNNGLEELDPIGEQFDPKFHEAIGVIHTDKEDEDHKILEVMQKGYILSGKIIRPAKVRIGEINN